MKSKKTKEQLEEYASSVMRWDSGVEVIAYLSWDQRAWYLWFEPTDNFLDWIEEQTDVAYLLEDLNDDLGKIGVQEFYDLDDVNKFCKDFCGDDDPAYFYEDELLGGICGA